MIRPPGWSGVTFSEASDGDLRSDSSARRAVAEGLGIAEQWATVRQVHGSDVRQVSSPGDRGEGDAMWTTTPGLPVAILTADCYGVVLQAGDAVGVAHAGWSGAAAGVVERLMFEMTEGGHIPERAAIGPGIGPCCFEVGADVSERFPDHVSETDWGAVSVDLRAIIVRQLEGVEIWNGEGCTLHEGRWFSHRRDATSQRMAAVGWLA